MKRLFFILVVFATVFTLSPQTKRVIVKLNALDFSRFPQSDLYVSLKDIDGEILSLDTTNLGAVTIHQNNYNMKPHSIQSVYELKKRGQSELYIALVFDNSESMSPRINLLEKAAERFIAGLDAGDYAAVFDFGDENKRVQISEFNLPLFARKRLGFSFSKSFLNKAVKNMNFTKRTYMYDALLYSLSVTNKVQSLGKKVIVFFSDGVNVGSEANPEIVQKFSLEYDIPIYAIDLNTRENPVLKRIAATSGGEYFFVTKPEDLIPLYESLIKLLKSQYRITYNFPTDIVDQSSYQIQFNVHSDIIGSSARNFSIDGEKIGYYNLLYYQSVGKEDVSKYINFISSYPRSKWRDDAELLLGNYWFRRNDYPRALAVYNRILRDTLNSAYSGALVQKAKLLTEANQLALAQKEYKQMLKRGDNSSSRPRAMIDLAKTYSSEGNYSLAMDTYSNLISEYQGTEFASEALLQSASLSLSMGDLGKAKTNLTELVTNYPESKNSVFARMELAKLEEKNQNFSNAVNLYSEVLSSNPPAEIMEEAKLRIADISFEKGNYTTAINSYSDLAKTASSPSLRDLAQIKLIPVYLASGAIASARETFSLMRPELKSEVLKDNKIYKAAIGNGEAASLANSSYYTGTPDPANKVLSIYDNQELRAKFPIIGPMYIITLPPAFETVPEISFTVERNWIKDNLLANPSSGVYRLENTQFIPVETNKNFSSLGFEVKNAPPGIYAILTQKPEVFTLYNIYFDLGKATIRKDAEKNLYQVIDYLRYRPELTLEIAGHTDSTGTDDINYALSLNRSEAIKKFMIINGVDPSRLTTRGYGSQFPLAPNNSEENRQKNRRTEFIILKGNLLSENDAETQTRYVVSIGSFNSSKEVHEKKEVYKLYFPSVSVLILNKDNKINYMLTLGIQNSERDAAAELKKFKEIFNNADAEIIKL